MTFSTAPSPKPAVAEPLADAVEEGAAAGAEYDRASPERIGFQPRSSVATASTSSRRRSTAAVVRQHAFEALDPGQREPGRGDDRARDRERLLAGARARPPADLTPISTSTPRACGPARPLGALGEHRHAGDAVGEDSGVRRRPRPRAAKQASIAARPIGWFARSTRGKPKWRQTASCCIGRGGDRPGPGAEVAWRRAAAPSWSCRGVR